MCISKTLHAVADPGFQYRVFPKINSIQRYEKYIISTQIYQYIIDFSIEKRATRVFPGISGHQCWICPWLHVDTNWYYEL
jgi:hypothetical protein